LRIARFARPVSLLLLGEQLADVDVTEIYADRAVHQAVDHRVGLHATAQPPVLFRRSVLGAENRRLGGVAAFHQLEQEADVEIVDVLREPFVQDQKLVARILSQDLRVRALRRRELVAFHQKVRKAHVARAPAPLAGLLGQAARKIALSRSRAPLDDDVGRRLHKLAGPGLSDEHAVDACCEPDRT